MKLQKMKKLHVSFFVVSALWNIVANQQPPQEQEYYIDCVPQFENEYSTMIVRPNELECPRFDCWESQMTLDHKFFMSGAYNEFRQEIAKKTESEAIYRTLWHWVLEKEAISIVKECPEQRSAIIATRDVHGLGFNMACEETITQLLMKNLADFLSHYEALLRDSENDPFNNFDDDGRFRRPSASYFGCAFVSTEFHGTVVCIYCTKASNSLGNPIEESSEQCPPWTALNTSTSYTNLCAPKSRFVGDLYGCEQDLETEKYCQRSKPNRPKFIDVKNIELVRLFYPILRGNMSTYLVIHKDEKLNKLKASILYCADLGGECPPILSKWTYVFDLEKLKVLDDILWHHKGEHLRFGHNNVIVTISQDDPSVYAKAQCCSYIFVSFICMFIIVSMLTFFTYKHSKINV